MVTTQLELQLDLWLPEEKVAKAAWFERFPVREPNKPVERNTRVTVIVKLEEGKKPELESSLKRPKNVEARKRPFECPPWIRILLGILLVCLFVATVLVLTELFQKESSESSPFKLHGRAPVFAAKGPKGAKDDNDGYDNGLENVGEVRQCWNFSGTLDPYDCPGGYEIATPTANYSLTCIYIAESSSLSISAVGASSTKGLKGDSSIKGVMAGHHLKQSKKGHLLPKLLHPRRCDLVIIVILSDLFDLMNSGDDPASLGQN
eukprot:g26126.t1